MILWINLGGGAIVNKGLEMFIEIEYDETKVLYNLCGAENRLWRI